MLPLPRRRHRYREVQDFERGVAVAAVAAAAADLQVS